MASDRITAIWAELVALYWIATLRTKFHNNLQNNNYLKIFILFFLLIAEEVMSFFSILRHNAPAIISAFSITRQYHNIL
ncbi:hypothetical protein, partial [Bacillus paranthracis]|uniref:hypothetical protein n=1 Tax=Bacillus paranthracis TaxID=2026186 RepID=UPI001C62BA8D